MSRIIKSRKIKWSVHIAQRGGGHKRIKFIGRKGRGKETTRKPKTQVGHIKIDVGEIGWGGVERIGLVQDRDKWRAFVNAVMNLQVPQNTGKL
jgi:hypothetical protein